VGPGGDGGLGGDGGDGGRGGDGAAGQALALYQDGGTSLALTSSDTSFNLAGQSVIDMENVACIDANCTFYTANNVIWNMGPSADPPGLQGGNSATVSYGLPGRYDVVVDSQLFEDFVYIQSSASPVPQAATSAPFEDGYYRLCVGSDASFTAVNGSSGYGYRWDLDTAASTWVYDGTVYQTLNPVTFATADTFDILLQYRTDCCGLSVADTLPFIIEATPDIAVTGPTSLCAGAGPITLSASGAMAYQWSPATGLSSDTSATVQAQPSATTTYQLFALSPSGFCSDQTSYTVTVNDLLLTPNSSPAGCVPNGSASVVVSNGSSFYDYLWSTGATSNSISNLAPGSYQVEVNDLNTGCSETTVAQVGQTPGTMSAYLSSITPISCFGVNDGGAAVAVSGASGNASYNWSNGATTASIGPVAAGTYSVTITDQAGCEATVQATVPEAPQILPALQSQTTPDCENFATAAMTASGGNGPYTFTWNTTPPQSGPVADNLVAGNYVVTVTDQDNCVASTTVSIAGPGSPVLLSIDNIEEASTCTAPDGSATVSATGNGVSYAWEVNPPQTGPTLSNAAPGSYLVIATGSDGCADTMALEIGPNCPLPTGLLAFGVEAMTDHLRLEWDIGEGAATLLPYSIERSVDGEHFSPIGESSEPSQRTGSVAHFQYADRAVEAETWYYYRLYQPQPEGLHAYSEVQRGKLSTSEQFSLLNIFPVPAKDEISISLTLPGPSSLQIQLINPQGKQLRQKALVLNGGITKLTFDLEDLASGVYLVSLRSANYGNRQISFLKQ